MSNRKTRSMRSCFQKEIRDRLIHAVIVAAIVATAITALTTGLTIWVSTLPAVTPVSLSLVFRSWTQLINFNLSIWLWAFAISGLVALMSFTPWFCVGGL